MILTVFRASLCPSSGAQEYYTVVAACGISCCKNVKNNFVEQAIRSAIKTSVASSWHFISTHKPHFLYHQLLPRVSLVYGAFEKLIIF